MTFQMQTPALSPNPLRLLLRLYRHQHALQPLGGGGRGPGDVIVTRPGDVIFFVWAVHVWCKESQDELSRAGNSVMLRQHVILLLTLPGSVKSSLSMPDETLA